MNPTAAVPPMEKPPGTPPGPHDPPSGPPPWVPPKPRAYALQDPPSLYASTMYPGLKSWHPGEPCYDFPKR